MKLLRVFKTNMLARFGWEGSMAALINQDPITGRVEGADMRPLQRTHGTEMVAKTLQAWNVLIAPIQFSLYSHRH